MRHRLRNRMFMQPDEVSPDVADAEVKPDVADATIATIAT